MLLQCDKEKKTKELACTHLGLPSFLRQAGFELNLT
jgi:hypothetical protein